MAKSRVPPHPFYFSFLFHPFFFQFDLSTWLNEAHPVFSERTRLLELIHGGLCVCGRDPDPELLTPFHLFTKHWTSLLCHHFPDHYSDCLRLLMTSKCVSFVALQNASGSRGQVVSSDRIKIFIFVSYYFELNWLQQEPRKPSVKRFLLPPVIHNRKLLVFFLFSLICMEMFFGVGT